VLEFGEYAVSGLSGYDAILISPGPGLPDDFPVLKEVILHWGSRIPILGICLGHQAIAEAYGGHLISLPEPRHGKEVIVQFASGEALFSGIPPHSVAGLYHSWAVSSQEIPDVLQVIASDSEEGIMGIRHRDFPVIGLQFHPESYITRFGKGLMRNWLNIYLHLPASAF
jgi:anthranilate synthase/aminodeoxychorismate synthase-like glutamine amidotransferase